MAARSRAYFPCISIKKTLKIFLSETTGPISILLGRNVAFLTFYQDCSSCHDTSKNMAASGRISFCLYIYIKKKVIEKSRECHSHKSQPFPDTNGKRKPTNPSKHKSNKCTKKGKRRVQGMPQSQTAALPRHQEEDETNNSKQTQIDQTYEKH